MAKFADHMEKIESGVVEGYKKIEDGVVTGYKKIEGGVVEGFTGITDKMSGVMLDEEGKLKGSALVMEFDDRAGVDEYLANEPYVKAGVWQKIDIETMNVVIMEGEKVGK